MNNAAGKSEPDSSSNPGMVGSNSRLQGGNDNSEREHGSRGMHLQQQQQQYTPLQQQGSGPGGYPGGSPMAGGVEVNRALYVGNLAPAVDEPALHSQFGPFGPIMHIQVRLGF